MYNRTHEIERPDKYHGGVNPNYRPGFYKGANPYRDHLMAALRHFGLTNFQDYEFWTLGGTELVEYDELVKGGFKFAPSTYHTVDLSEIRDDRPGVVRYPMTEFLNISQLWKKPLVLNFDSTRAMTATSKNDFQRLINLALLAVDVTGRVFLSGNFMTDFMNRPFKDARHDPDKIYDIYASWLGVLTDRVEYTGRKIEFHNQAHHGRREVSTTSMIGFYCMIMN